MGIRPTRVIEWRAFCRCAILQNQDGSYRENKGIVVAHLRDDEHFWEYFDGKRSVGSFEDGVSPANDYLPKDVPSDTVKKDIELLVQGLRSSNRLGTPLRR